MRAAERQRGSGQQLRRQYVAWPGNAMKAGTLDRMLVGRRGISPVMIGRAAALDHLTVLVIGSGGDRDDDIPAVALVAGEAGVGKTRLIQELISSVPTDTKVLVAQADPGSLGRPLALVRSLLGDSPIDLVDARAVAVDAVAERIGDGTGPARSRRPPLGRLRQRGRLRTVGDDAASRIDTGRHLPTRRADLPPPRRRDARAPRAAPSRTPDSPRAPRPRRGRGIRVGGLRAHGRHTCRGRVAQPHRWQSVLPRGDPHRRRRRRARGARRATVAVDARRGGQRPARRPLHRSATSHRDRRRARITSAVRRSRRARPDAPRTN